LGLRRGNETGNDNAVRHEFRVFMGFRKFFRTWCVASGMSYQTVEMLVGSKNESSVPSLPDNELQESYFRAIPLLTIAVG